MRKEITIIPKSKTDTMFPRSYYHGDKQVILVDKATVFEGPMTPPKNTVYPGETRISFDRNQQIYKVIYEVDDNGEPLTTADAKYKEVAEKFFMRHPFCTINGKPHKGTINDMFDIVDTHTVVVSRLNEWDSKRRVANYLSDSELDTLRDICYYYGVNPSGKTKGQICLELGDYSSGRLYFKKNEITEPDYKNFLISWVENIDPDREFIVNCRKAVNFDVITTNYKDGRSNFYLGNTFIGVSFEDIVAFFKREPKLYSDYVVRGVRDRDVFSDEVESSKIEQKSAERTSSQFKKIESLRRDVMAIYNKVHELAGSQTCVPKTQITKAGPERLDEYRKKLHDQFEKLIAEKDQANG